MDILEAAEQAIIRELRNGPRTRSQLRNLPAPRDGIPAGRWGFAVKTKLGELEQAGRLARKEIPAPVDVPLVEGYTLAEPENEDRAREEFVARWTGSEDE